MAQLEINELLYDPDFSDDFSVIRTAQVVDARLGTTVEIPSTYFTFGVVAPGGGDQLNLLPDVERTTASITVITPFKLQTVTDTTEADIVLWGGKAYRVTLVSGYENWGDGFTQATCLLTTYTLAAPVAPDPSTLEN